MAREPLPEFAKFQLTPSRRATDCQIITYEQVIISTHALTEGDNSVRHFYRSAQYFNSRPHGGRRGAAKSAGMDYISTHALTEGDFYWLGFDYISTISTHALTEGDHW